MSYVLLVEDNQENADMVIRLLESLKVEVRHFIRGLDGAAHARKERPMLILMDFNLPDIDGRMLVLTLKKQLGGLNAPPIAALTARSGSKEVFMAERFGCSAFISKPFAPDEFLRIIKQLVPNIGLTPSTAVPALSQIPVPDKTASAAAPIADKPPSVVPETPDKPLSSPAEKSDKPLP
jgi:CheY-like chemotaxis protein